MKDFAQIVDRLFGYLEQKNTARESAVERMLPERYLDPVRFAAEQRTIIRGSPTLACLSADIPRSGDYLSRDEGPVPYFVCRDPEGGVRAFLNACRHRGARLVADRGAGRRAFACPYHAWTYNLRGDLLSVHQEQTFGCIDKAEHGLIALPCGEKHGMVFVSLTPGPLDLDAHLGSLGAELGGWRFEDLTPSSRSTNVPCRANWKLVMETFCEVYHVSTLHSQTIPYTIGNVSTYDRFGLLGDERHARMCVPLKTLLAQKGRPLAEWASSPSEHVHHVYFIYPNVSLYVAGDAVAMTQVFPGETIDQTQTRLFGYHRPGPGAAEKADAMVDFLALVLGGEDFPMTRAVQKTLETGLLPFSVFGRNELSIQHLHQSWDRHLETLSA